MSERTLDLPNLQTPIVGSKYLGPARAHARVCACACVILLLLWRTFLLPTRSKPRFTFRSVLTRRRGSRIVCKSCGALAALRKPPNRGSFLAGSLGQQTAHTRRDTAQRNRTPFRRRQASVAAPVASWLDSEHSVLRSLHGAAVSFYAIGLKLKEC